VGDAGRPWSGPAWHLPGLDGPRPAGQDWHEGRTASGDAFRAPRLDPDSAARVARAVRDAVLEARARLSIHDVVRVVARAAGRLADAGDPAGRAASDLLRAELGWSTEGTAGTLRGMAEGWTAEALGALLAAELGDPLVLDSFRPDPSRPGRRRRAVGPPLLLQLHAGNVPGVAVTGTIRGLLARSGVLSKAAEDEPGLLALFARTLAEEDALLGRTVAATWWPGGERVPAWDAWAKHARKVVVYGGDSAVSEVRARVDPATEVVAYGPRLGVAVLLADAPADTLAGLARDLCAYEQRGCVSPRIAYAVGVDPLAVAERLDAALAGETRRVRPAPVSEPEAVALRAVRAEAEFGGFAPGAPASVALGPDDLAWTVIARRGPGIESRALPRAIWVYGVEGVADVLELLAPFEGRIQALGYAGREGLEELAEGAARLGVSRIAPVGTMAWPPADWRHEGRHQLLPLLRWTDLEMGP
jgi:hypothetical protein